MQPVLRCGVEELSELAGRYQEQNPDEDTELLGFRDHIHKRGYMVKHELQTVAHWKSPRSARRIEGNSEEYVQEITRFAFQAETERARIELLTLLDGVQWPTASVILHFYHQQPYPILDFRALWAVSLEVPNQYTHDFWREYVGYCRERATQASLDMRTLDQALWQCSKERQAAS